MLRNVCAVLVGSLVLSGVCLAQGVSVAMFDVSSAAVTAESFDVSSITKVVEYVSTEANDFDLSTESALQPQQAPAKPMDQQQARDHQSPVQKYHHQAPTVTTPSYHWANPYPGGYYQAPTGVYYYYGNQGDGPRRGIFGIRGRAQERRANRGARRGLFGLGGC